MIKIHKGNTRIAVILLSFLVIKMPNPRFDWWVSRFKHRKSFLSFIAKIPMMVYGALLYGISANIIEGLICYNRRYLECLVPVFSIGICNFQIYQGDIEPTKEEIKELYDTLPQRALEFLAMVDLHTSAAHNWRRTNKGLKLFDYAVSPMETAWATFLGLSAETFNEATPTKK